MTNIDIGKLYWDFINYCWIKVSTHNKNSIKLLSDMITTTKIKKQLLYTENTCDFLQEDKVKTKILEIVEQSKIQFASEPINDETLKKQIEFIKSKFYELKLIEFIKESDTTTRVLSNITRTTGVSKEDLIFENLFDYFYSLNTDYFNILLIKYLDSFVVSDQVYNQLIKDNIKKYIINLPFSHKSTSGTQFVPSLSIVFMKNYVNLQRKENELYDISDATSDFEQADVINYPSIKIFCTTENNDADIFNRFTYLHEIGHFLTVGGHTINIMQQNVCIGVLNASGCGDLKWGYNLKDKLELIDRNIIDKILSCSELINLNELFVSNKSYTVFLDIFADLFAFSIIIDELEASGKSIDVIFTYVKNICAQLSGDENHFSSILRFILNVYFNEKLRTHYESLLQSLPIEPYVERRNFSEYIKNSNEILEKLKHGNSHDQITKINDIIEQINSYKDEIITEISKGKDFSTKAIKYIDYYISLSDSDLKNIKLKVIDFFEDFSTISIYDDDNQYKIKYLKYKNKYLALKNLKRS